MQGDTIMNANALKFLALATVFGAMLTTSEARADGLDTGIAIRGIGPTMTCSAETVVPNGDQIDGRAHNLRVNCTAATGNIDNYAAYTGGLPYAKFCVARIAKIVQKSGSVKTDPITGNPNHCLVNNIKVKDLVGLMTPKP
jgi:hypothetical protein